MLSFVCLFVLNLINTWLIWGTVIIDLSQPNEPFSEEGSKKAGVLYVVNQLFSMYFKLNTLRLCKNLLK